jgi:hypothetical protein
MNRKYDITVFIIDWHGQIVLGSFYILTAELWEWRAGSVNTIIAETSFLSSAIS